MPTPAGTAAVYPLSPLQQGMLAQYLQTPSSGVDIEQVVVRLPESIDARTVQQAWMRALRRHAILRTSFRWQDLAQACQRIHATAKLDLSWLDWRTLSAIERNRRWEELLASDRRRGFNLAVPPLWRLHVVRLAPRLHDLLFTFHHILLDGRSLILLLQETLAAPGAARPAASLEPVADYRDYLTWLQTRSWRQSETFWRRTLKGLAHPTPLPGTATPPPVGGTARHHERTATLPPELVAGLRRLAAAHGFTLNTIVLGMWALLLGRYSGEDSVTFGAVRACRHTTVEGADSLVGLMINTVPLRVALPAGQPAVKWLEQLREQWIALRAHENTPLAEIHAWSELPPGIPLFSSVVNYQEPSWDAALQALGGAWAHRGFAIRSQPGFPLALDAAGGADLKLTLLYQPGCFTESGIRRLLAQLVTLFRGLAEGPQTPLAQLPLLTPDERRQILHTWNQTAVEFPANLCLHHLVEQQVANTPAALAVADGNRQLTYGELDAQAATLARELQALGIGPETCVAVCLPRSVDYVVGLLAVLKAGGAYVPLDPASPAARLAFMVTDSRATVVLTLRRHAALFEHLRIQSLYLDSPLLPNPDGARPATAVTAPGPRSLAYVIYTSGSTGTPKGVAVQHASVVNLVGWHRRAYQVTAADRATLLASPAFDASGWELWPYLASGASVHVPPEEVRSDPTRLPSWLAGRRITLGFVPTPLAEALLDQPWPPETSLRALLTGGDRLRRWPGRRLPCPLVNHYGPTEFTVVATWTVVPLATNDLVPPSIGQPIANAEAYVLDRNRQPVPIGVAGELYLGGAGLARGYHHQPELTAEKFVPHPFRSGARVYRTGDLVRWRSDGRLDFLGRVDQQLKIRGHRIEPAEIELRLRELPGVRESLVIARDEGGPSHLVAYLVPSPGRQPPAPPAIRAALAAHLPAAMLPEAFVTLSALPLTANGKVDRAQLPAPRAVPPAPDPLFAAPQGLVEAGIARIWAEVLGRDPIGATEDFFELGGHSLRAAQVVSRINATFAAELNIRSLFDHPTVAGLARLVGRPPISTPLPVRRATAPTRRRLRSPALALPS